MKWTIKAFGLSRVQPKIRRREGKVLCSNHVNFYLKTTPMTQLSTVDKIISERFHLNYSLCVQIPIEISYFLLHEKTLSQVLNIVKGIENLDLHKYARQIIL